MEEGKMELKEYVKKMKENMSPFRWKMMTVGEPIMLGVLFAPGVVALLLFAFGLETAGFYATIVWIGLMVLEIIGALVFLLPWLNKQDVKIEMERSAYLFKEPKPFHEDSLTIVDEDLIYTLDKEGVKLEIPGEEGEQVFDEAKNNVFYIAWERAELHLASQAISRRMYLAMCVFDIDADEQLPFFIPIDEDVYAFMKKHGLDKKMDGYWQYLTYNPEDAVKQILLQGHIVRFYDRKTGKRIDFNGDFYKNGK